MRKLVFNFGLNKENLKDFTETILKLIPNFDKLRVEKKEKPDPWNDTHTLILEIETDKSLYTEIQAVLGIFNQESCAVKVNGEGRIFFNENYTGMPYEFNQKFFVD